MPAAGPLGRHRPDKPSGRFQSNRIALRARLSWHTAIISLERAGLFFIITILLLVRFFITHFSWAGRRKSKNAAELKETICICFSLKKRHRKSGPTAKSFSLNPYHVYSKNKDLSLSNSSCAVSFPNAIRSSIFEASSSDMFSARRFVIR